MPRGDQGTKTLPWAPRCFRTQARVEFAVGTPILSHADATGNFALGTPECSGYATRGPGHEDLHGYPGAFGRGAQGAARGHTNPFARGGYTRNFALGTRECSGYATRGQP